MPLRSFGGLVVTVLIGIGLFFVLLALAVTAFGDGNPGFGYKKLLLLLFGAESCACGFLLWRRLRRVH